MAGNESLGNVLLCALVNSMMTSLSSIFSDSSKAHFARVAKPAEFSSKKRPHNEIDDPPKKVKKPKHKHRKPLTPVTEENAGDPSTSVDDNKDQRTIFVGNIPISATLTSLRKYFQEFGPIESLRLRSVPIAGTAVDESGNQDLVRKVCVNSSIFGDQKGSYNAYVVFQSQDSQKRALTANNRLLDGRHLRVDQVNPTLLNPKTSVFLGSLPFYTDEEELREHFAKVCCYMFVRVRV